MLEVEVMSTWADVIRWDKIEARMIFQKHFIMELPSQESAVTTTIRTVAKLLHVASVIVPWS